MNATVRDENRFKTDAARYAAYLDTPMGRLRADLVFANLQEFLPASTELTAVRALDLGCGTGAAALRLAQLGIHVTMVDSSAAMLALAQRAITDAGASDNVALKLGDAVRLDAMFPPA